MKVVILVSFGSRLSVLFCCWLVGIIVRLWLWLCCGLLSLSSWWRRMVLILYSMLGIGVCSWVCLDLVIILLRCWWMSLIGFGCFCIWGCEVLVIRL